MRYLGGKSRLAAKIVGEIRKVPRTSQVVAQYLNLIVIVES